MIFLKIMEILQKYSKNFIAKDQYLGSKAKMQKPAYHLYGSKEVSVYGRKAQPTYIAGVIQQKNYVSFYFSPVYSHPNLFQEISLDLKKLLKGKSCFNIKKISPGLLEEIEKILMIGINIYKKIGWI